MKSCFLVVSILCWIVQVELQEQKPWSAKRPCKRIEDGLSIYNFTASKIVGKGQIDFSQYQDKIVVIVNVASLSDKAYQFHELNALQSNYEEVEVVAFPCNQFGAHEPGANGTEILNTLKHVRPGNNFQPRMHVCRKTHVNGENENALFAFLKARCPPTRDYFKNTQDLHYQPLRSSDIRWDFEKFLVDFEGQPLLRYDSETRGRQIMDDVEHLKPRLKSSGTSYHVDENGEISYT